MATAKKVPDELLEQLRRDRQAIAAELPELMERGRRLDEAAVEDSLTGHLRRAIHHGGKPLKKIAAEVALTCGPCATSPKTLEPCDRCVGPTCSVGRRYHPDGTNAKSASY